MVVGEARGALNIVVAAVFQGAVGADDNGLATAGKLHRRKLFLVVLLERRAELVQQVRGRASEGLDVWKLESLESRVAEQIRREVSCLQQHRRAVRQHVSIHSSAS